MTRRVAGVVALLVAAPAVVVATFLPLYAQQWLSSADDRMTVWQTAWKVDSDRDEVVFTHEELFGVPLVAAAALLVLGAARVGAMWGRLVAFGGAALLLGSAWTVAHLAVAAYLRGQSGEGLTVTTTFGPALPLLGLACAAALGGALAVQEWPRRAPAPAGPVVYRVDGDDDTDTPPLGLPLGPAAEGPGPPGSPGARGDA